MKSANYSENRLNAYIDPELATIAKSYFRNTRYRSLSGFFERALRSELRRRAPLLRAQGVELPQSLFEK